MNTIKQRRGTVKGGITRLLTWAEAIQQTTEPEEIEVRLTRLIDCWKSYEELTKEECEYLESEDYVADTEYEAYETKYFRAHSLLSRALRNSIKEHMGSVDRDTPAHATSHVHSEAPVSSVKLPNITIPTFRGDYRDWMSFHDVFVATVDENPSLSSIQKFHYLKSFLGDSAANLIKHMAVTDSNYNEALQRLKARYDRKDLIIRAFVESFLTLPTVNSTNAIALRKITDGADEAIRGLNALNSKSRDPFIITILLSKVDDETKSEWAKIADEKPEATFDDFLKFLSHRCSALESIKPTSIRTTNTRRAMLNFAKIEETQSKCPHCDGEHSLSQCNSFKNESIEHRRAVVKKKQLCFNCLKETHIVKRCPSQFRCKVCKAKHHTLVHVEQEGTNDAQSTNRKSYTEGSERDMKINSSKFGVAINNHTYTSSIVQTILPTAVVDVIDNFGKRISCRLLCDSGSTATFISEAFVQRVGLKRSNARISVVGIASNNAGVTQGRVTLQLFSRVSNDFLFVNALILSKLTTKIPVQTITMNTGGWRDFKGLSLADSQFHISSPVDLIVGSDQLWSIITGESRKFSTNVIGLSSRFGWIISGSSSGSADYFTSLPVIASHALINIDQLVRTFMELESVAPCEPSKWADSAEVNFSTTHTRSDTGSYIVEYPFKSGTSPIGATLSQALKRLFNMERKFIVDPDLKKQYVEFMSEYLALQHMERISPDEINADCSNCFYLPHHAVMKEDSTTTKCRVVFDGSCRDSTGVSLNDRMHVGPPIQRDLFAVCLRFRQHQYVLCADIEKMFRGILVSPGQRDFQRIVWRSDAKQPVEHFRLLTVTYGLGASPFLAVRVLHQIASDYKNEFPRAAQVLTNDTYVDDILTGCSSLDELVSLRDELSLMLSKANLKLRKWCSNSTRLLEGVPKHLCEFDALELTDNTTNLKILGIRWRPGVDEFFLKISPTKVFTPTKRNVLSEIAKIFDPLGLVAPTVILFKILFQRLWFHGLGWDDDLPNDLRHTWDGYMFELPQLESIRIPRCISSPSARIELHGFADASSNAYAAVLYGRFKTEKGYETRLITAKTKVAPLRPVSIPRLELCAAFLLAKLIKTVKKCITLSVTDIWCWTDSEIVLHWLSSPPRRWKTFVCNRTAEILDICPRKHWRHVQSSDNPADCASRGLLPCRLIAHTLWWSGPSWLSLEAEHWPTSFTTQGCKIGSSVNLEENPKTQLLLFSAVNDNFIDLLIQKISSWSRLCRIMAFCKRFVSRCRLDYSPNSFSHLNSGELQVARTILLQRVQHTAFRAEIDQLQKRLPLHPKSTLICLTPFVGSDGLLRVGGRLKNSSLNYNIKHPIILPKHSSISLLIVRYIHESNLHTGVDATYVIVKQQYWILGCRNLVRQLVFKCRVCFMQRRATSVQLMGNLPAPRVYPSRCFLHCGLDYAGPVSIKISKGRTPKMGKAWFALFVCLSTKAMHLELVSDLTTESFLASFRRFIARRGKPTDIYSDNGTTFRGAKRAMGEYLQLVTSQQRLGEIQSSLAGDGIKWHFIPPSAPNFGGLWESGVRSIKLHLRRVIGSSCLTFEEYYTVLTQIESILNSRPLCSMSDSELDPLTPAHFLIGEPYTCLPEPSLLEQNICRLQRWRHLQAMVQGFWKRWRCEYLTTLQQRKKWHSIGPNIEKDMLVVLKEPNVPTSKWVIGRIVKAVKGNDGLVRVVTVKTACGEYTRPISKIAVLPCF